MNQSARVSIKPYPFNRDLFKKIDSNYYLKNNWPIVYILSNRNSKKIYIGETTDFYTRMATHLNSADKRKMSTIHIIYSDLFNKSATLDIESYLIQYISADGYWKPSNQNFGLSNHNYRQRSDKYWSIFLDIWKKLRKEEIAFNSIPWLTNSNLFKYSPFKALNNEQQKGLVKIMEALLDGKIDTVFAEGGAGTGKSLLAIYLFNLLMTDIDEFNYRYFGKDEPLFIDLVKKLKQKYKYPRLALAISVRPFRFTIKKVFANVKSLKASMVISPAEVKSGRFDIIIVDEAHRLRRNLGLGKYEGGFKETCTILGFDPNRHSELNWVRKQSDKLILFYDHGQTIRPSDVRKADFNKLKSLSRTDVQSLRTQMRSQGGNKYIKFSTDLLDCSFRGVATKYSSNRFDLLLFDSVIRMRDEIRRRDKETDLSRMIAGYSWKWVSKANPKLYDIYLENRRFRWNKPTIEWIHSSKAIDEIGCIHTTMGYDLNYAGIIFGREISYDKKRNEMVIFKDYYYDTLGKIADSHTDLKEYIINIYRSMMHRSIKGTYIYAYHPELREYFSRYIQKAS